jgi:hypothetical protein
MYHDPNIYLKKIGGENPPKNKVRASPQQDNESNKYQSTHMAARVCAAQ